MLTRIDIDREAGRVLASFAGTIVVDDFAEGRRRLVAHPDWSPAFAHVLDFLGVDAMDLSAAEIRGLASMTPVFELGALQVLVAKLGSAHYGLARMFQMHAEGAGRTNVHIVGTLAEAEALVRATR